MPRDNKMLLRRGTLHTGKSVDNRIKIPSSLSELSFLDRP